MENQDSTQIVDNTTETNDSQLKENNWPPRPDVFNDLLTPIEAAMFLRLDQIGHSPKSARRTLKYWRDKGELKATKYGKHVWYLKEQLEAFLRGKTES